MNISVVFTGDKFLIKSDKFNDIEFLFPFENSPQLNSFDFAIWAVLPIAMRLNENIHIKNNISQNTIDSAMKISSIWSQWLPDFYTSIKITTDNISDISESFSEKKLVFFSGGVDSTYSSLRLLDDNLLKIDCLTVHGMDYKFDDEKRFEQLLEQTREFCEKTFNKRRIVKTNIYSIYNKIGCNPKGSHVTHIFSLFSCGSLFEEYSTYFVAADYRLDQQFIVHPYGSNTATNRLMYNKNGRLMTLDDDVTRAEKVAFLFNKDIDLSVLTICVDYNSRPKNCGICSKCMRTKAMFFAARGELPDIFLDKKFDMNWYENISLSVKINRTFMLDILAVIDRNGLEKNFPGYSNLRYDLIESEKNSKSNPFYGYKKKDIFKFFLKALFN